ncbi:GFA family protein [Paenirhodobacter sp.]|uniref:GFA family protein n=1 Tax=Paenirhodobacter sp. TaxID=1965326 RepID=UPI003B3E2DC1
MAAVQTGTCLCGDCSFTARPKADAGVCHCAMCRKWSGGIYISVESETPLEFAAGAPIRIYPSSEWGERLFCGHCGSSLAWRTRDGAATHVSIQCFADPAQFNLTQQIYIDCKPGNYALANTTQTMTEAEVLAMVMPTEGNA